VRGAAVWALSRLMPRSALESLSRDDNDDDVKLEWAAALA
jgi:hypothetical protein